MAITKTSENGYVVLTEALTIPDSAGANVVTVNGSKISEDLSNRKLLAYCEITTATTTDGDLDLSVQGSMDGVTYVDLDASVIDALDTSDTSKAVGVVDLSNYYAPYYRIQVFTDGADIESAGACSVKLAYKE